MSNGFTFYYIKHVIDRKGNNIKAPSVCGSTIVQLKDFVRSTKRTYIQSERCEAAQKTIAGFPLPSFVVESSARNVAKWLHSINAGCELWFCFFSFCFATKRKRNEQYELPLKAYDYTISWIATSCIAALA